MKLQVHFQFIRGQLIITLLAVDCDHYDQIETIVILTSMSLL